MHHKQNKKGTGTAKMEVTLLQNKIYNLNGVTMLASVLKSKKAVAFNIANVCTFVALRKLAANYKELMEKIMSLGNKYDLQFLEVYAA